MSEHVGRNLTTFTGFRFWPLDPRAEEIEIEDIAHALSMQCRFGGHCKRFYSVAEHSLWVSALSDEADALWGLLHDAAKAYLVDVPRPIKRLPALTVYRQVERRLLGVIVGKFGLTEIEPESVRRADELMLAVEGYQLCYGVPSDADVGPEVNVAEFAVRLGMTPGEAEVAFLRRFGELRR